MKLSQRVCHARQARMSLGSSPELWRSPSYMGRQRLRKLRLTTGWRSQLGRWHQTESFPLPCSTSIKYWDRSLFWSANGSLLPILLFFLLCMVSQTSDPKEAVFNCFTNSVNKQWLELLSKKSNPPNVLRWYNFIKSQEAVTKALASIPEEVRIALMPQVTARHSADRSTGPKERKEEGKFVELPGAEMGKVVVRFPPEASGWVWCNN